jgi:putative ABC transport system permease protein
MIFRWLSGLLRHRAGRLVAVTLGVVTAVALVAAIGAFLVTSKATMTDRAVARVAVDWQVQVAAGADAAQVAAAVAGQPGTRLADVVGFASVPGLTATTTAPGAQGGSATTQTTGAAQVLGIPDGYRREFPGQLRTLAGADSGVLVAQQTAANLHVGVGDAVAMSRPGLPDAKVTVQGVVDLPQADTLFQTVGAPAGAQPTAPPDNVLLLPAPLWHQLLDPMARTRPDLIASQVHVARETALPADPAAAYVAEGGAARNTDLVLAGSGTVGDNLAATLGAAREDALYAQILFLFLGLPGAVLAGLLTNAVAGAGRQRREREQALLRSRGATHGQALALAAAEATAIGVVGTLLGLGLAAFLGRIAFGSAAFGATPSAAAGWIVLAAAGGLAVALATILLPAERAWRVGRVVDARALPAPRRPLWLRLGLDVLALAGAAAVISATSKVGYSLVLAPEGVAAISVDYWAFLGPALLWAGGGLLCWRLVELLLRRGQRVLTLALRPVAGPLAGVVAAGLGRSRALVVRGAVVLALAVAFAVSTAVFNATYEQQALVDARLTNGSDVAVSESIGTHVSPSDAAAIAAVPGVRAVEPLQHRFAYVGADLQDLFGVRPGTVAAATSLQDSWFTGGTADQLMAKLAATPDGVLVSAETVTDYQLSLGDAVKLRVQTVAGGAPVTATFHYVGVANEFPTAPKDSFLVANADYLTKVTGDDSVGAFLVDTGGHDDPGVTAGVRHAAGPAATVTPLSAAVATIGSSLSAVDLHGLTVLELGFAFAFGAAAGGLVLAIGLAERRRNFALLRALGARSRQAAAFVVGEAATIVVLGLALGAVLGAVLSRVLVAVLTGVFDPPPSALAVPWTYLAVLGTAVVGSIAVACVGVLWWARRAPVSLLREG